MKELVDFFCENISIIQDNKDIYLYSFDDCSKNMFSWLISLGIDVKGFVTRECQYMLDGRLFCDRELITYNRLCKSILKGELDVKDTNR